MGQVVYSPNYKAFVTLVSDADKQTMPVQSEEYADLTGMSLFLCSCVCVCLSVCVAVCLSVCLFVFAKNVIFRSSKSAKILIFDEI